MKSDSTNLDRTAGKVNSFKRWLSFAVSLSLIAVPIVLTFVYYIQPDRLAPVTLVPPWLWLIPGVFITWISNRFTRKSHLYFAFSVWVIFGCLFVEEPRGYLRTAFESPEQTNRNKDSIRLITLNCNVGKISAVKEVIALNPDIILLQESPPRDALANLTHELFGDTGAFVYSPDCSIIASGPLEPIAVPKGSHFVHAVYSTLPSDTESSESSTQLDLISLRLSPPVFRTDFVEPGFWSDHTKVRVKHRQQLATLTTHIKKAAKSKRLVVGGDFNLVPNDGALTPLQAINLVDSFRTNATGWCNTATNDWPIFRVDQVWTKGKIDVSNHWVRRTRHSDHRMVIVDIKLK